MESWKNLSEVRQLYHRVCKVFDARFCRTSSFVASAVSLRPNEAESVKIRDLRRTCRNTFFALDLSVCKNPVSDTHSADNRQNIYTPISSEYLQSKFLNGTLNKVVSNFGCNI